MSTESIILDPEDPFEAVLVGMVRTNRAKRSDYAGADHWSQNFYDSAYQLGNTAGDSCEQLIATKQSRLRVLLKPTALAPKNEGIQDTLLDRAVYSAIALGIWNEGGYDRTKSLTVDWIQE